MALIEQLENDNWQELLRLFFGATLDVLKNDPYQLVGSSVAIRSSSLQPYPQAGLLLGAGWSYHRRTSSGRFSSMAMSMRGMDYRRGRLSPGLCLFHFPLRERPSRNAISLLRRLQRVREGSRFQLVERTSTDFRLNACSFRGFLEIAQCRSSRTIEKILGIKSRHL